MVTNKDLNLVIKEMITLHSNQKFKELKELSQDILKNYPSQSIFWVFLGLSQYALKNYSAAIENFKQALKINTNDIDAYINLGSVYSDIKDYDNAEITLKKALKIKPNDHKIYYNLGIIYEKTMSFNKAISFYKKAIEIKKDYSLAYNNLGNVLQNKGKILQAEKNFTKAISYDSNFAEAYRHLGRIKKYTSYDNQIKKMEKIFLDPNITDHKKTHIGFALGEAFANLKNYKKSFFYFENANKLRRSELTYSIQEDINLFDSIKNNFEIIDITKNINKKKYNKSPIFIVGMLRSGTTLVEQILSTHSMVYGAGELTKFPELISEKFSEIEKKVNINKIYKNLNDRLISLGNEYMNYINHLPTTNTYITDKLPLNFMWIGFIKKAIPNAIIIHCTRNPYDNCLSIFKNYFVQTGNKYSYNLKELGQYFNLYTDIMLFWKSKFPSSIYEIKYESLVNNQEYETKKLLEHCNIKYEKTCLNFYYTKREINTASSYQVRQPIYSSSINYWKNYKMEIRKLIKIINI